MELNYENNIMINLSKVKTPIQRGFSEKLNVGIMKFHLIGISSFKSFQEWNIMYYNLMAERDSLNSQGQYINRIIDIAQGPSRSFEIIIKRHRWPFAKNTTARRSDHNAIRRKP